MTVPKAITPQAVTPTNTIRVNNPVPNTNDVKPNIKVETTVNPQKKNEIFSTSNRDRIPVETLNPLSISSPVAVQSNILEEKKVEKEIKTEIINTKINIPITTPINQIFSQPSYLNGSQTLTFNSDVNNNMNNTASFLINKLNNNSQNSEENLLNILKESGFTQDKIKSGRTGLLQSNTKNSNYVRQTQQSSYNKPIYPIQPNTQIDMDINNINLAQNFYIDNQGLKTNKNIPSNINSINNNPLLIKALKDNNRGLQFYQNIAAQIQSVNNISNNFSSNAFNLKNDIINCNIEQDLAFQQNPQNPNIIPNYRNSQYLNKGTTPTNLYVPPNQLGKNNYTIVNPKGNNMSNMQANSNVDDDIMNSFSANNNYD